MTGRYIGSSPFTIDLRKIKMDHFNYKDGRLFCENVSIDEIAVRFDTPVFVYSQKTLLDHLHSYQRAFSNLNATICYSVKSCSNLSILKLLVENGAGMDVVSGGELSRAVEAGVPSDRVAFAGVGKTDSEIRQAIKARIGWFNVESEAEFEAIERVAADLGEKAVASLRVNPDVWDPRTHAKTTTGKKETKFGVDLERAKRFFQTYGSSSNVDLQGIHVHIGSPIYSVDPYERAIQQVLGLIRDLGELGYSVKAINIGGGFAADYETGMSPTAKEYAAAMTPLLTPFVEHGGKVLLEPGRSISCNAGVLITQVVYKKVGGEKSFLIVNSGMHHLIRPTLYDAWQFMWPTEVSAEHVPAKRLSEMPNPNLEAYDVVGPICETGDYLALNRRLPPMKRGDLLCVFSAGAYGMVMASNYNSTMRPAEVLVDNESATLIRRRETIDDLLAPERLG